MVCKNNGICGFLSPSWVPITYNTCPPVIVCSQVIRPQNRTAVRKRLISEAKRSLHLKSMKNNYFMVSVTVRAKHSDI